MDNFKSSLWHSRGYALIVFFTLAWALVTHEEAQKEDDSLSQVGHPETIEVSQ